MFQVNSYDLKTLIFAAAKKCNLLHLGLESANKLTNTKTENINENIQKVSVLKQ